MVFTFLLITTFASFVLPLNAPPPMAVTLNVFPPSFIASGTVTEVVFLTADTRVTVPLPLVEAFVILYL